MGGEVILYANRDAASGAWRLRSSNYELTSGEAREMKTLLEGFAGQTRGIYQAFIPYPYLVLGYVIAWGGILGWRARRYRSVEGKIALP